ncbi:MAG: sigma-70 family RNA polymerase sigma factor [Ginsengibacter sp.]
MSENLQINQFVDHLFRHEAGRMVSVLTRIFGTSQIELAEDVVQDSLVEAINQWTYKGVPENPKAWLYKVAKNKALNFINREKHKRKYSSEVMHFLKSEATTNEALENIFSETAIQDDQLRMMFTCCHPSITGDSQVSLTLKTLCGFSIPEIARAFLTSEENINKRLVRARQKIRDDKIPFEVPDAEHLEKRLDTVIQTIYLLFNEGYSASKGNDLIRYELCGEAIRLAEIIANNSAIQNKSNVFASLALMYLNASRFKSRLSDKGEILTMAEQDRKQWDRTLIQKGFYCLDQAILNKDVSLYHILAAISAYHCSATDFESTDWSSILSLYDKLLQIDNSPVVMLNRTIALSKVNGVNKAIEELEKIKNNSSLASYHLLYSTLAEFYIQINKFQGAANYLKIAIRLSSVKTEKDLLQKKLDLCNLKTIKLKNES